MARQLDQAAIARVFEVARMPGKAIQLSRQMQVHHPTILSAREVLRLGNVEIIRRVESGELSLSAARQGHLEPPRRGVGMSVPAGEGMAEFYRRTSQTKPNPGHGVDGQNYRKLGAVVLLADCVDLTAADRAICSEALALMEKTRQVSAAYRAVEPIARRIWGKSLLGMQKAPQGRGVRQLKHALTVIEHTVGATEAIDVPYLGDIHRAECLESISKSMKSLTHLRQRIKGEVT